MNPLKLTLVSDWGIEGNQRIYHLKDKGDQAFFNIQSISVSVTIRSN